MAAESQSLSVIDHFSLIRLGRKSGCAAALSPRAYRSNRWVICENPGKFCGKSAKFEPGSPRRPGSADKGSGPAPRRAHRRGSGTNSEQNYNFRFPIFLENFFEQKFLTINDTKTPVNFEKKLRPKAHNWPSGNCVITDIEAGGRVQVRTSNPLEGN